MSQRYIEGDVLLDKIDSLIDVISSQTAPARLGTALISARFIPQQTVRHNLSVTGVSDYDKVSNIMFAVIDYITNQSNQKEVTQKFDELVLLLYHRLKLDGLAKQLARGLSKCVGIN